MIENRNERGAYVGVSGVVDKQQQQYIEKVGRRLPDIHRYPDTKFCRAIGLGIKAVHNTQWLDEPNKYGERWYPVGEAAFRDALDPSTDLESYNIAQMYLDPDELAANPLYAPQFVERVLDRGARWIDAIQFDMLPYHFDRDMRRWNSLFALVQEHPNSNGSGYVETILQCHGSVMEGGAQHAVEQLKHLEGVDRVLFDASHGRGKEMRPDDLRDFLDTAYASPDLEAVSFGIAGGLDADAVDRHMPEIVRNFPDISWDAEARLHMPLPTRGEKALETGNDGSLDTGKVGAYLAASARVLLDASKFYRY